jgi:hypothetical protein
LLALGLVAWCASLVALWAGRGLAGLSPVGLRALYGLALVLGWSVGNLYVARTRGEMPIVKRILLPLYLLAPAGVLFLIWSTATEDWQVNVPMAPVYASGIHVILFLVPVSFARSWRAGSKD